MVLQSEYLAEELSWLSSQTFSVAVGEDTTANFDDNSLTTTHVTISDGNIIKTIKNNNLILSFTVDSGDAVGDTLNAFLVTVNGEAFNKCLFNSVTKTATQVLQFELTTSIYFG